FSQQIKGLYREQRSRGEPDLRCCRIAELRQKMLSRGPHLLRKQRWQSYTLYNDLRRAEESMTSNSGNAARSGGVGSITAPPRGGFENGAHAGLLIFVVLV